MRKLQKKNLRNYIIIYPLISLMIMNKKKILLLEYEV